MEGRRNKKERRTERKNNSGGKKERKKKKKKKGRSSAGFKLVRLVLLVLSVEWEGVVGRIGFTFLPS